MSPRTIEAADDVWEFITYLANSLLFLLLGFELALTHIVQSFQGNSFGLLGAVIGRLVMIYLFIPLQDIVYGMILVTLLGQGLTLRVLLPRWKEKLVRAEVEGSLPTQA